jgi:hypothetical protein
LIICKQLHGHGDSTRSPWKQNDINLYATQDNSTLLNSTNRTQHNSGNFAFLNLTELDLGQTQGNFTLIKSTELNSYRTELTHA